jgi:hypothetical protein
MAGWESKYTELKNINGGNKYTTDSQLTVDMFIVPIENAEYAVQKSLNAESIANSAKTKVDSLAKVASSGSYDDLVNKPIFFAPTSAGTNGYVLKSNGSGEPTWVSQSDLTVGKDSEGNVIKDTYATKTSLNSKVDKNSGTATDLTLEGTTSIGGTISVGNNAISGQGLGSIRFGSGTGFHFEDLTANKLSFRNSKSNTVYDLTVPTKSGTIAVTSDIPKKLSELTNDINNLQMEKTSWTLSNKLPSKGLYLIKFNKLTLSSSDFNVGTSYFIPSGGSVIISTFYWFVSSNLQHYYVNCDANGNLKLYQQTGNTVAEITGVNFYYIKLS